MSIRYRADYKYQLAETYSVQVDIEGHAVTDFVLLDDGLLTIRAGYAWNGPNKPAIDTKNFRRPSLVHDALCQLMREGHLSMDLWEPAARLLQRMCIEDGMSELRAWWVYRGVRFWGSVAPPSQDEILTAP